MAFLINFRPLRKAILLAATLGVCAAQTSDDANYSDMLQVTSSLNVYYKLTSTDSGSSALSVKAVYQGLAWLSIGVNPDGEMIGGDAVIGQPDEAISSVNPGKYTLSSEDVAGVVLMDSSAQTLINGSITQDTSAKTTTLSFTKILDESGENTISESGKTTFIYAIGSDNTYPAYHGGGRGSFKVNLSGVNLAMVTPAPTLAPTASTGLSSTITGATPASPTSSMAPAPSARTGSLSLAPPTSSASPSPSGSPTMHSALPASQIGAATDTVAPSISQAPVSLVGSNALSPTVKVQGSKASPAPFKAMDSSASPSPFGSSASPSPAGADVSISSGGYSGTDDMFSTPTGNNGGGSSGSPSPRPISATVNKAPSQIKSSLFSLSETKPSSSTDKRSTASPSPSGSSSGSPQPIALNSLTSPSTKASLIGAATDTVAPSVSQAPVSLVGSNALSPTVKVQGGKASPAPFKAMDSSASPSPFGSSASPSPAGADVSISSGGYSGTDDMFSTPTGNNGGGSSGSPSPRPISATVNKVPSQIKSSLFSLSETKPSSSETDGGRYIGTEN